MDIDVGSCWLYWYNSDIGGGQNIGVRGDLPAEAATDQHMGGQSRDQDTLSYLATKSPQLI